MKSKSFYSSAQGFQWIQKLLVKSRIFAVIFTLYLVSDVYAMAPRDAISAASKNASQQPGIALADGTHLLVPSGWDDTSGFGISFWFPDMTSSRSSDGKTSSHKVHLLSIELGKLDPRPIGRVTPEDEYANIIAFTGKPTITPIPGSNLLALAYPESQKRHPTYHFADVGSVDYIARADAPFSAMLQCSKLGDCSGDVRIKSINIQYRIGFDESSDASKIIEATNRLISSWVIPFK